MGVNDQMVSNTIAISAGHHPGDSGAKYGIYTEYGEMIKWQALVIEYLSEYDIHVVIVPSRTLNEKIKYINDLSPIYAIELHLNGNIPNASGCETLYYPGSERGYLLGSYLQDAQVSSCGLRDRGIKERDDLGFLKYTNCPAVITETEFISNYSTVASIRDCACKAIAEGIYKAYEDGV